MYTTEFVEIPLGELLCRVQTLKHEGLRFVQMCAETTEAGIDLLYTFYDETCDNAPNLCVYGIDHDSEVPSIQGLYFAAFSYENETHDLYGVKFINMQLDFGGNFFNVATDEPMTIISPEMKAEREKRGLHYLLEVDGGVDDTTAPLCVEAGADVLVAGSAVFGKDDRTAAVRRLAAL